MKSKYFLKKNRKYVKEKKKFPLNYDVPITTSIFNSTILQTHEKLINKNKKKSWNYNKNRTYNEIDEEDNSHNLRECKEENFYKKENNEIKKNYSCNYINKCSNFREESNEEKSIKIIKKKSGNLNEKKEDLYEKYEKIISLNRTFNNLMKNLKLSNKELAKNIKCENCKCTTILKKGKYGNFLICKSCFVKVSKKNIDSFIFNEKEKEFYKNKRKISFEIENKYSFRIHFFGNINFASNFNQIISEIIKEIIIDLKRIKKNKIKYRNIIKYIYKINNPLNKNNNYFNNFFLSSKKRNSYDFYNFSFKRIYYANLCKKNNYIKRKKEYHNLFLYNNKFTEYIETKINAHKKYKDRIKKYLVKYVNNDFFQEIFYLPLTWKPRKDYITSGIFPFHLSKDTKKIESFRRLSVNNNNYLCGCVFNLCSYPLILHYFIYKLFNFCFIYEIPKTIYNFFRNFYPTFNKKFSVYKHFLKNRYLDTIPKIYEKYKSSLSSIKKNYFTQKNKQLEMESREEKCILNSYNFEELSMNTCIVDKQKLRKEIIRNYYMKKEHKIKKKINKEIKNICLEEIKKKLPRRIRKAILQYQLETVYFFKKKKGRILIADEMGLGKTLQSISIFYFYNLNPTLIICPSSLKINWLSEIEKFLNFLDTSKILIINSSNDLPKLNINYRIIIVSFNMFKKLYNIIKEIKFKLIIVDESHYIRTVHYGRQSELTKMIKKKIKKTKNIIFLSGTPSINRPINIFHQIKFLINNNKIFCKNKFVFGEEFCKKYFYRGEKIYEENLRSWEFYIFLKKIVMIRRIISDVFKNNFPNLKRFFIYLPNNIPDILESEKTISLEENKKENNKRSIKKNVRDEKKNGHNLMSINKETRKYMIISDNKKDRTKSNRQLLNELFNIDIKSKKEEEGISKVINALHFMETYFPNKKKIIFCYHIMVCKCIEEELLKIIKKKKEKENKNIDYIVLSGCILEKEKMEKINYFKTNGNCYYGIFTICSVSHGLDFSFCNLCFFIELPVNFFHLQQCESRLYRKNQKLNTFIFYFLLQYGLGSDHKTWKRFILCSNSTRSITDGVNCEHNDLFYENFSNHVIDLVNDICNDKQENQENQKKESIDSCDLVNNEVKSKERMHKENKISMKDTNKIKNGSKEMNNIHKMNEDEEYSLNDGHCNKKNTKNNNKDHKEKRKKKKRYLFEVNTLTNRIHAYHKNRKTNFTLEELNNLQQKRQILKRCANKFLENYNKLSMNEKRWIEKRKCDANISLLKYLRSSENKNMQLKFQRYIKNTALKNKKYVKAYIEQSFKGKFQIFYYQEYDEKSNKLMCLNCKNPLPFSESIIAGEDNILLYLKENSDKETVDRFKKELETIKLKKSNIKKIIICHDNNLFCEGDCRKHYFLKKSSCSLRRLVFERDKGICNNCNLDCVDLIKQIKKTKYFSINERINYFIKFNPLFIEDINHLKKILEKPKDGYIWQIDHILPVCKGGGEASFENLQTLCFFCHKKKTKNDVRKKKLVKEKKSKYF